MQIFFPLFHPTDPTQRGSVELAAVTRGNASGTDGTDRAGWTPLPEGKFGIEHPIGGFHWLFPATRVKEYDLRWRPSCQNPKVADGDSANLATLLAIAEMYVGIAWEGVDAIWATGHVDDKGFLKPVRLLALPEKLELFSSWLSGRRGKRAIFIAPLSSKPDLLRAGNIVYSQFDHHNLDSIENPKLPPSFLEKPAILWVENNSVGTLVRLLTENRLVARPLAPPRPLTPMKRLCRLALLVRWTPFFGPRA